MKLNELSPLARGIMYGVTLSVVVNDVPVTEEAMGRFERITELAAGNFSDDDRQDFLDFVNRLTLRMEKTRETPVTRDDGCIPTCPTGFKCRDDKQSGVPLGADS